MMLKSCGYDIISIQINILLLYKHFLHLKTVKPTIIMIMEKPCFSVFDVRVRTVMTGHDWLTWDDTGGCHRQAGDSIVTRPLSLVL